MFPDYKYVSLENPKDRQRAKADPESFLKEYSDRVIFDEAQRFPDLFSYLQGMIDEDRRPGRFILSGSQNFLLRKNITQSLAGRVGIVRLLPLDNSEMRQSDHLSDEYAQAILKGGYPGLINLNIPRQSFYDSYISSYLERDVAELVSAVNLDLFQRFIEICATKTGQVINLQKMAKEISISPNTAQSWLGILEQSYIVFRLQPFFRNIGKRVSKTSKMYFYDTGLVCYLLGLYSAEEVEIYDGLGALFENLVIADAIKSFYHNGHNPRFYFYRDSHGQEVDLVYEQGNFAKLWEIKTASSFKPRMTKQLEQVATYWDRPTSTHLIYTGDEERRAGKTMMQNWRNLDWSAEV